RRGGVPPIRRSRRAPELVRLVGPARERVEQARLHPRLEKRPPGAHGLDRLLDLSRARVLREVAACPRLHGGQNRLVVRVCGQRASHAGTSRRTRNPSGTGPASSVPPSRAARSRMPVRPWPPGWGGAGGEAAPPWSSTVSSACPPRYTRRTVTSAGCACLRTF